MAHPFVVQIVEAHLKANFSRCTVLVENEVVGTPDDASEWLLIDFPWCRSSWITADEFEEEGAFRAILALQPAVGAHVGREWLEEIAALFRGRAVGGVQFFAPQSPASGDQNDAGGYWRLEITVPYRTTIEG